ncbi:MAG TPA: glycosyl hydrolase, partial [Chitinophagaceae bacterium]|nr:glycosyl hydrolase [Chitinophagaceae bacterium]
SSNNYQAQRLLLQVSDDGRDFRSIGRLQPPRHGWQDTDADVTHSIAATTARCFRFVYDKTGSEPGAEDLDAAKWKPTLKISGIELLSAPRIHQYEGKTGAVWRISPRSTAQQLPDSICVPMDKLVNITAYTKPGGRLVWKIPPGRWIILRMGHTSTGHTNATGGGGKGLECDKFNPVAVKKQFDNWFGEALRQAQGKLLRRAGDSLSDVVKILHVDSWECGSQNWSPVFRTAFQKKRGYDPLAYLPAMAGIPLQSAETSERFLYDIRTTIAELVNDSFYTTLAQLAHRHGCALSAESVAPTMTSDGLLHYKTADIPMGEFWLNSPTHDKPNDMLDAISGAHIYGKNVVQAESFTTLRMAWDEYPAMLKPLQDRNYALGINRLVYHVFVHNPWTDRRPGMTLDGIGLYFQRDQTWWKPAKAWMDYTQRCQALLQVGVPVTDIAVFTGDDIPRRAQLPDRLVSTLPGLPFKPNVNSEALRLQNAGEPVRESPTGVFHSANMMDPADWPDPLHGYQYDSFNPDALLHLATVKNGRVVLPGGASYAMLVMPGIQAMQPNAQRISAAAAQRIWQLVKDGATVLINDTLAGSNGLLHAAQNDKTVRDVYAQLAAASPARPGKGRILKGPLQAFSLDSIGLAPDFTATYTNHWPAFDIAFAHRRAPGVDIYFVSNQRDVCQTINASFRIAGRVPELWDAVTGDITDAGNWQINDGRTQLLLRLEPGASLFVVFRKPVGGLRQVGLPNWLPLVTAQTLPGAWTVSFDSSNGGPGKPVIFDTLYNWSCSADSSIRYYSGTAVYTQSFTWDGPQKRNWLSLGNVRDIAQVTVNGIDCGVAWTAPWRVEITKALRKGNNNVRIEVTNTWANRLQGDHRLPLQQRITNTTAPYRLENKPLPESGLLGPVCIQQ